MINVGNKVGDKMPLYPHELYGKSKTEDVLTSQVFGIIENIDREKVLYPFLKDLGIDVSIDDINSADFHYWKTYEHSKDHRKREPDVVIETKSSLIFFEVKVNSDLYLEQIKDEYEIGETQKKSFFLIVLTQDFIEPQPIFELKSIEKSENIFWLNWNRVYEFFEKIINNKLDKVSNNFAKGIKELLENKGYRGFKRFDPTLYSSILNVSDTMKEFYTEIAIFIKDLSGLLSKVNIERLTTGQSHFYRDGRSTNINSPKGWCTSYFNFVFKGKDWRKADFYRKNLFFRIYFNSELMRVGFTGWDLKKTDRKLYEKYYPIILEFLKENEEFNLIYQNEWYPYNEDIIEVDEEPDLSVEFWDKKYEFFEIAMDIEKSIWNKKEMLIFVSKKMQKLIKWTNSIKLFDELEKTIEVPEEIKEDEIEATAG